MKITVRETKPVKPPMKAWCEILSESWFFGHILNGGLPNAFNFKINHNACLVFSQSGACYPWLNMEDYGVNLNKMTVANYQPVSVELIATKENQ